MSDDIDLLIGWEEIAGFLRMSESTARAYGEDLIREDIIFRALRGSPPKPRICAFKSDLKTWLKAKDREQNPPVLIPSIPI